MVHCCIHKSPPLLPVLRQVDPVHSLPSYWRSFHYSPSIYVCVLQVLTFFHVSVPKHYTSPSVMWHAPPTSSSVCSYKQCLVKSANYEAAHLFSFLRFNYSLSEFWFT
jgi:hypothetical protein